MEHGRASSLVWVYHLTVWVIGVEVRSVNQMVTSRSQLGLFGRVYKAFAAWYVDHPAAWRLVAALLWADLRIECADDWFATWSHSARTLPLRPLSLYY